MTDRTFNLIVSIICAVAAIAFGLILGAEPSFVVGILMFFCGGFCERAMKAEGMGG